MPQGRQLAGDASVQPSADSIAAGTNAVTAKMTAAAAENDMGRQNIGAASVIRRARAGGGGADSNDANTAIAAGAVPPFLPQPC